MKKFMKLFFALAFCASMTTGCNKSNKDLIGISLPNQATSLNVGIGEKTKELFTECDVMVQSAEDSATNQKQQIDAFVTMGAKMIVVAPVEIKTLDESLKAARDKGIKVVISGANDATEGTYDAVTVSNEYLVGNDIALLAKKWAEERYTSSDQFETLVLKSTLGEDPIIRSNGMLAFQDEYLKNKDGQYIDENNEVVDESAKIKNPCYSELISNSVVHVQEMGLQDTGRDLVSNALTTHPKIRLVLMYGSLFAAGASQYIVDNYKGQLDEFGLFGGGVSGNEGAYLLGSLSEGVGQKVEVGGIEYAGVESVFRGAVSFGGEDAASTVAELAYDVYYGQEGIDYEAKSNQTIGLWFTAEDKENNKQALACITTESKTVEDFEPWAKIEAKEATIKWKNY